MTLSSSEDVVDRSGKTRTTIKRLGTLVRHDGPEHVFCFAPTRAGKGVWPGHPDASSPWHLGARLRHQEGELALTGGWRRKFSRGARSSRPPSIRCVQSAARNPPGTSEVKDTQNVADILVDPTGEKDSKDHWQTTAHSLLGRDPSRSLRRSRQDARRRRPILVGPSRTQRQALKQTLSTSHLPAKAGPHPVVAQGRARDAQQEWQRARASSPRRWHAWPVLRPGRRASNT